jgi:hypothetical protein
MKKIKALALTLGLALLVCMPMYAQDAGENVPSSCMQS